jgi:hypothetical protein
MPFIPPLRRKAVPAQQTFGYSSSAVGISGLPTSLTINSITKTPTWWYEGRDASLTNWTSRTGAETLTAQGAGGEIGIDVPTPSTSDKAAHRIAGTTRYWKGTTIASTGTDDLVIEAVIMFMNAPSTFISTRNGSGSLSGIMLRRVAGNLTFQLVIDGVAAPSITAGALGDYTWNHVMIFCDRSGSGQIYVNGAASGAAAAISSASGSLSDQGPLSIGDNPDGGGATTVTQVAHIAMWKGANWLDTHLQATVAASRASIVHGSYMSLPGISPAVSTSRNSAAYIAKYNGTARILMQVGPSWNRVAPTFDGSTTKTALTIQGQFTNDLQYSEDTSQAQYSVVGVTKAIDADSPVSGTDTRATTITEDAANTEHYLQYGSSVATTNGQAYGGSFFVKALGRSVCSVAMSAFHTFDINLTTGVVSNAGGTTTSQFHETKAFSNGWWQVFFSGVGNATSGAVLRIKANNGSGTTYAGNSAAALAVFALSFQATNGTAVPFRQPYIRTIGSPVTQLADRVVYSGLTNNFAQGTIVADALMRNIATTRTLATLRESGGTDDSIKLEVTSGNLLKVDVTDETVSRYSQTAGAMTVNVWKQARFTWNGSVGTQYVDNVLAATAAMATTPIEQTVLEIGTSGSGTNAVNTQVAVQIYSKPTMVG